jgi:hypothetical protein
METPSSRGGRVRDAVAAITLWVPLVMVAGTWLSWHSALPADLPRQWGSAGVSTTWPTALAIVLAAFVCLASAVIATASLRRAGAPSRRKTFLFTGFAAGMASGVWLLSAGSTIAAGGTPPDDIGAWPLLMLVLLGYGLIPFLIAHRWIDDTPKHQTVEVERVPTETEAWIRTVTVPLFLWLGLAIFAMGVVLLIAAVLGGGGGGASELVSGLVMLVVTLPVLACGRLRISVDWRGLTVATWIMGISVKTIPLNEVESVQTTRIEPLEWGGWGYRIRPGTSAIILRTGQGLVVNLTNGKQFALTLTAPETPVAILTALSRRLRLA